MLIKTPYIKYFHTKHCCCESLAGGRHGPQKPRQEGSAGDLEPGEKNHEKNHQVVKSEKNRRDTLRGTILEKRLGSPVARDDSYFLGPKMRSCSEPVQMLSWTAMTRSGRQNATAESGGLREAVV